MHPAVDEARDLLREAHIYTYVGLSFYFDHPTVEMIDIRDIAHALSNICRWTGHVNEFYSVAQHCVICSQQSEEYPLRLLLHDAGEAYYGDINKPLKMTLGPAFDGMADNVDRVVFQRFGLGPMTVEERLEVKHIDKAVAITEAQQLLGRQWVHMYEDARPIEGLVITPLRPEEAEELFLTRFQELRSKEKAK
jgi:5'-deoxynucleotidase YfbR-like HD superfamily hydrolase